jgi:hypothetical protein
MKPKVLGQLVEIIFKKMELAGEAGSLLKMEEEMADAVDQAREEFNKELLRRKDEAGYLPGMAPKNRDRSLFDFADLPDKTQFWHTAEEKILAALKGYAEQAEAEDGGRLRLFVEDAAKGFSFINLCRERYDVVLMNPPFGDSTKAAKNFIAKRWPKEKADLGCCFVSNGLRAMKPNGRLGVLMTRTPYFLSSFAKWREHVVLASGGLTLFADLGLGVLEAMVETCACVYNPGKS